MKKLTSPRVLMVLLKVPVLKNTNSHNEDMPVMERPKRSTRTWNRKRKYSTESDVSNFGDEIRDKDFVLNSSENDCGSDKGNKSSHVTDEEDPHRRNLQILLHNI